MFFIPFMSILHIYVHEYIVVKTRKRVENTDNSKKTVKSILYDYLQNCPIS